jgi:adenine-specific DNA-methyltransferase
MENTMTNNIQKVKDDLIAEIDKRIADKIIEQTNADLLKKLIEQAETINEAIMVAELGTTYKRTGFHFDKRLEKMTDTIKYFKKNEKLSFVQDKNALTHKLIIGDNYDALLNLLVEYRGKIDVIYIDPPYGKDSMGEFAKTNYENAITRDNLLSMLYPRLVLARQLLSDNGVIFCSIDDKNQAYVKGLFDEVFGESSFVANFIWKKKGTTTNVDGVSVSALTEYILCYRRKTIESISNRITLAEDRSYPLSDEEGNYRKTVIEKKNEGGYARKTMLFSILGQTPRSGKRWQIGQDTARQLEAKNRFIIEDGIVKLKIYDFEDSDSTSAWPNLLLDHGSTDSATKELKAIFNGESNFENPKPPLLISSLLEFTKLPKDNGIVLDFFAGSGTTGQAVLELNKDGGKRQFILATSNEITDTTPNGIVNDVTSKRLKRVMTGECYDGTKDFKWNEENKPLGDNLDVYDIATVAPYSDEPFTQINETFYGKEKLGVNEKIKWVCENFEGTQKTLKDK